MAFDAVRWNIGRGAAAARRRSKRVRTPLIPKRRLYAFFSVDVWTNAHYFYLLANRLDATSTAKGLNEYYASFLHFSQQWNWPLIDVFFFKMKVYASGASTYILFVALPRHFSKAAPVMRGVYARTPTRPHGLTHGRTHARRHVRWPHDRASDQTMESLEWRRRWGGVGQWIKGALTVFFF
jgi:hypothetical protein